jgi:hypothetical protein
LSKQCAESFILVKQLLDGLGLVSQVNTELLTLLSQILEPLSKLIAIKGELTELFIATSKFIIVILHFLDFVLESSNHANIPSKDVIILLDLSVLGTILQFDKCFGLSKVHVVSAQSTSQSLCLLVVVE